MDSPNHGSGQAHFVCVVVNRDEKGYGMKVSGDNPVYVQSVKEGKSAKFGVNCFELLGTIGAAWCFHKSSDTL